MGHRADICSLVSRLADAFNFQRLLSLFLHWHRIAVEELVQVLAQRYESSESAYSDVPPGQLAQDHPRRPLVEDQLRLQVCLDKWRGVARGAQSFIVAELTRKLEIARHVHRAD